MARPAANPTANTRYYPRARTAAFFDLDKTIIAKSSTLAFSKPSSLRPAHRRAVLKSSYAQFIFLRPVLTIPDGLDKFT